MPLRFFTCNHCLFCTKTTIIKEGNGRYLSYWKVRVCICMYTLYEWYDRIVDYWFAFVACIQAHRHVWIACFFVVLVVCTVFVSLSEQAYAERDRYLRYLVTNVSLQYEQEVHVSVCDDVYYAYDASKNVWYAAKFIHEGRFTQVDVDRVVTLPSRCEMELFDTKKG